jgi:hypothetical protein
MAPTNDPVLLIVGELRGKLAALQGYTESIDADVKQMARDQGKRWEEQRKSVQAIKTALDALTPGINAIVVWRKKIEAKEQRKRDLRNKVIGWIAGVTLVTGTTGYTFADRIAAVFKAAAVTLK